MKAISGNVAFAYTIRILVQQIIVHLKNHAIIIMLINATYMTATSS